MLTVTLVTPALRSRLQKCYEYGNQKLQTQDYKYATEMFAQCVAGDPANLLYMNSLIAALRLGAGSKKKGFSLVKKVALKGKTLNDQIKDGVERLRKNPWDAQTFIAMGLACLETEQDELRDPGLAYLKHAVESAPDDVEVIHVAAVKLTELKVIDQALACWSLISKLKKGDLEADRNISDLMLERTITKVQANARQDEENQKEDEQEKLSVEDQCEKRLRKNPEDRDAFLDLVNYFFQKNNMKKTEDACKRALKVFPDDAFFFPKLLETQKARALADLQKLQERYKSDPSDSVKEQFEQKKKDLDRITLEYIQYRLKRSPGESALHLEYGNFLMQHKQFKEAISEFQTAKVDATLEGQCLLNLALCFQNIKQYSLALQHYKQAVQKLGHNTEDIKKAFYYGARLALGLKDLVVADQFASQLASIDFSYKDVATLLDKITKARNNS
ncbi:MAG: hypothetical protein Q4G03_07730 [Planctomycetia bacterium]|nr:hypothetical protein [Planctomycetia bacterium]